MTLKNFIVFEGIDGAGTSTQQKRLQKRLQNKNVFFTAEPTKNDLGLVLRSVLKGDIPLHPSTIARLFATDRCEHLFGNSKKEDSTERDAGIKSRCEKNQLCISDRYFFSSIAYQSPECGWDIPFNANKDFPLPQIVFFFDIHPEISLERIGNREVTDIYENKNYLEKTAQAYEKTFEYYEKNHKEMELIRIDATKTPDEIEKIIWSRLEKLPILST